LIRLRPEIFTFWLTIGMCPTVLTSGTEEAWRFYRSKLDELVAEADRFGFRSVTSQVQKIFIQIGKENIPKSSSVMIAQLFTELSGRIREEMEHPSIFVIPVETKRYYEEPSSGWESILKRYPSIVEDVDEAGRCLATDRLTACVFHLMRIVESAVVDLLWLTGKDDHKAHTSEVYFRNLNN
jgi:hypothetical protein